MDPAEIQRLSEQLRIEQQAAKMEARVMAKLLGMPEFMTTPDGRYAELIAFRNNQPIYYITNNKNAAISTRANKVYTGGGAGLSLTGAGVTLGIWDGGSVRSTHIEVTGRVTIVDGSGNHWHAGHVGGTMIGSGVWADAKGMSPAASLRSFDWNSDIAEMTTEAGAGLRISNHSYGSISGWYTPDFVNWWWYGDTSLSATESANFGFYDWDAFNFDNVSYNNPNYLIVKSAGNDRGEGPSQPISHQAWNGSSWVTSSTVRDLDGGATGYDTLPFSSVAKNILTIGAVDDVLTYTGPGSVLMSSFSGWGPTDDGRIKPDIVGNGVNVTSLYDISDTTYAGASGTSMSGPNVAGSLGLLVQHHRNLNAGADMLGATLKALTIHTADEAGGAAGPDYAFGWGLMDTEAAAAVITLDKTANQTITENVLTTGGTYTKTILSNGVNPIRVTIAWTDPAATPPSWSLDPSAPMLVNDLDLRVSNGTTFFPWVLDPSNPSVAATTGDNFRDNVEQVLIPTPAPGLYTITVTHKGAALLPSNSQAFSMIVSGNDMTSNAAQYVSQSVPTLVGAGSAFVASVTMKNTGSSTWSEADLYRMISVSPLGNTTWGSSRIYITGGATVPYNSNYTFTRSFTAPSTPGTYTFRWRMTKELVGAFGDQSPSVSIVVAPPRNAEFVSQSVPAAVLPGATFSASVTMKNTGTDTWSEANAFRLMSQNPSGNTTFGASRMYITGGATVATNASYTFTRNFTAPLTPGTYNFQWKMNKEGVGAFGATTVNVPIVVTTTARDARYESQTVPAVVAPSASFAATVRMTNMGSDTWSEASLFRMFSQNPSGNTTWGSSRMYIAGATTVPMGSSYNFSRTFTAPSTPGTYDFRWRMTKEMVGVFGLASPNVQIIVTSTARNSQFVSQSVPSTVAAGATFTASVTMRNIGLDTWSEAALIRLISQNPNNNTTWGSSRMTITGGATVAPGASYTFTKTFTAPLTPGNYNFQWRTVKEAVGAFGATSPNVVITVT